jgi:hypothetical protein
VNSINVERDCEPFKMPAKRTDVDSDKAEPQISGQQLEEFAADYGFRISPDLSSTQRLELLTLLYKYKACFARNMKEIRRFKNYELEVTLKDKRPSFRRQYKLSQDDALECHRQIEEMADCGIIEPSQNSVYQSAIFTVRKSSGQKRAVLDLRSINEKLEPFLLQLPDMNQLLHSLAGQKGHYYSTFDLAASFNQIPLKNGITRDITSFCDPVTGLRYRYTVAPFGLAPSPAAMITVLMGIMSPLVSQNIAYVYMDDISVASSDWSGHLERLETVLKTLDMNNLSCQPTKTSLAFPSIKFLGFEVSKDGLKITDDKVKIIKALKPPHDKKSLQKIFGIWNFFRNFCPKFSQSTFHMRKLLKKDAKFDWSSQCQAEFESIVQKLSNAPILQPLSVNKDFFIYTDSSYFGTAFAAFQPQDENPNQLHVVGYGGQALTEAHKSWSVLQIELLAVYHALKTYENYCRHRTVHIFSDNISLVYLKGMAMGSPREKRMATYLMGFRLNFHHVSGKRENMLADSLSRCFEDMTTSEIEEWIPHVDPKDDFLFAISTVKTEQRVRPSCDQPTTAECTQPNAGWYSYSAEIEGVAQTGPRSPLTNAVPRTTSAQHQQPDTSSETYDSHCEPQCGKAECSSLRADAPPFYPPAPTGVNASQAAGLVSVHAASTSRCHSPAGYTHASHLHSPLPECEDSSPAAEVWYDCVTDWPQAAEGESEITVNATQLLDRSTGSEQAKLLGSQVCATKARRRNPKSTIKIKGTTSNTASAPQSQTTAIDDPKVLDVTVPRIQPSDYETDTHLKNIYAYLTKGMLTGNDSDDRVTLLLSEDFFVDSDGILYRISLPRGKKITRVQSTEIRLALPQIYLAEVVARCHDLGHFSKERNFEFLRTRFYAKNLYDAVVQYQKTCDKCQRMKKDKTHKTDKLHSLPVPSQPNEMWATDHLILSRPTADGKTAIIIFQDAFSKWPVIRLVKDTSALEAAKAFVEGVISVFGLNPNGKLILNSDKGSAFTSSFFKEVCKLLNVRLITSASQVPSSNGFAESCVKAVKQGLKIFADSDLHLKDAIPLIELSLRSQPHSATRITPFECIMGRKVCLPIIVNDPTNNMVNFKGDQIDYYNFISKRLHEIHDGVKQNIEESKARDEEQYNKRHNTETPTWKIGDEVLITDKCIKKNSDKIITRPHYHGSFYITDIIENPGFGPSYRLVRKSDGRPLRHLVSSSRLRAYTAPQRAHFHAKYPALTATPQVQETADLAANDSNVNVEQPQLTDNNDQANADQQAREVINTSPVYEPAIKILKERKKNGKSEFLVLFESNEKYWANEVTPALERAFRIQQEKLRKSRRRRARH